MVSCRKLRTKQSFFLFVSIILALILLECVFNYASQLLRMEDTGNPGRNKKGTSKLKEMSDSKSKNSQKFPEHYLIGQDRNSLNQPGGEPKEHVLFHRIRSENSSLLPWKVVHLDLKGAPPKISFLKALFPLIANAGANAILIEYEDMFPYKGSLRNISALNAYSQEEVLEIIHIAENMGLEVIPLIQTFGHLEFALKLEEFKHLRELPAFPQELCPSRLESLINLVYEMIRQIAALHPNMKRLHIGCDEVYHIAACSVCSATHKTARQIFTDHISTIARHMQEVYPGVRPLIWDDMFRSWMPHEIANSGLGDMVDLVVWIYSSDIFHLIRPYIWYKYCDTFQNVWVASAFKGASGATSLIPNMKLHYNNTMAWIQLLKRSHEKPVRGIILTGWSRYDHFASLCELLPVAVPSLVLNLLVTHAKETQEEVFFKKYLDVISCPPHEPRITMASLEKDEYQWSSSVCNFPGNNLFGAVQKFVSLKQRVKFIYEELTERHGWMSEYHVRHNFSSPYRIIESFLSSDTQAEALIRELREFENHTAVIMTQYFDNYTVNEWREQNISPLMNKMQYLKNTSIDFLNRDVWPRRPLV